MKLFVLVVVVCSLFISCSNNKSRNEVMKEKVLDSQIHAKPQKINKAIYYWKARNWDYQSPEEAFVNQAKIQTVYIKFFEVTPDQAYQAIPITRTRFRSSTYWDFDIIPTVFIDNNVLKNYNLFSVNKLAENIWFLIEKIHKEQFSANKLEQIQIDCDWTKTTKASYFALLHYIKLKSELTTSCTLRLYPFKYKKELGIPPVDRVSLMCYNLNNPLSRKNRNTILDLDEFEKYIENQDTYPLPMDIALPLFEFKQHYRNEEFQGMLSMENDKLLGIGKKTSKFWLEVTKDTLIGGNYLRKGDQIKWEKLDNDLIVNTIDLLKKNIHFDSVTTVSFFHLDDIIIKNYNYEMVSTYYNSFLN